MGDNAMDAVVTRFKTVAYGGTPLNDGEAEALLASVGLWTCTTCSPPPGTPALAVGRSPSQP